MYTEGSPKYCLSVGKRLQRTRPNPSKDPRSSCSSAEIRPDWAWDVARKWTVSSDTLKEILELKDTASLPMNFILTNNPQGVSRQV
jgi:hypothetical protein